MSASKSLSSLMSLSWAVRVVSGAKLHGAKYWLGAKKLALLTHAVRAAHAATLL
eukprot:CAMPEP_0119111382 /NCGR_PEP_ID=MMETSP1180-20130426/35360_1 /TAXON_ID=3052 ORGANISM="Chlamydomonas cf sp, Strain CCMP681" /NCGR_SAMPLE_ID=MMETSP1180 /ASSEMBLY_ACC=CAM_ASM_000741 /LENGTH=53 /DNA_ID=CAMNT_0007098323 /DNA_START=266 /DNA_END=424 /DNA_ORIENTATION=+